MCRMYYSTVMFHCWASPSLQSQQPVPVSGSKSVVEAVIRAVPEIILRGGWAANTFLSGGGRVFC